MRRSRFAACQATLATITASLLVAGATPSIASADQATPTSTTPAQYAQLAEQGITQQSGHWKTSKDNWYCEYLRCSTQYNAYPLLTVWGIVRMFESVDAVALARADGRASRRGRPPRRPGLLAVLEPLSERLRSVSG